MTVPYTYLIKHLPTGKVYYGCRFAKNCHPSEFWVSYKTSSKQVKNLIEQYGEDSFIFEIRKTFSSVEKCRLWEHKVLRRMSVTKREDFLNQTDNISFSLEASYKGLYNRAITEKVIETARVMGKTNLGKKRSESFKTKLSNRSKGNKYRLGKKDSAETRFKKSNSKLGKPSNAAGNYQPRCSCLLCGHETTTSNFKRHLAYYHTN